MAEGYDVNNDPVFQQLLLESDPEFQQLLNSGEPDPAYEVFAKELALGFAAPLSVLDGAEIYINQFMPYANEPLDSHFFRDLHGDVKQYLNTNSDPEDSISRWSGMIGHSLGMLGAAGLSTLALPEAAGMAAIGGTMSLAFGAMSGSAKMVESFEEGHNLATSTIAGVTTGAFEAATEAVFWGKILKPGLKYSQRLLSGVITENFAEMTNTLAEMKVVDEMMLGKSYSMEHYKQALIDTLVVSTAISGGVTTAVHPMMPKVDAIRKIVEEDKDGLITKAAELKTAKARAYYYANPNEVTETAPLTEEWEQDYNETTDETVSEYEPIDVAFEEAIETDLNMVNEDTVDTIVENSLTTEGDINGLTQEAFGELVQKGDSENIISGIEQAVAEDSSIEEQEDLVRNAIVSQIYVAKRAFKDGNITKAQYEEIVANIESVDTHVTEKLTELSTGVISEEDFEVDFEVEGEADIDIPDIRNIMLLAKNTQYNAIIKAFKQRINKELATAGRAHRKAVKAAKKAGKSEPTFDKGALLRKLVAEAKQEIDITLEDVVEQTDIEWAEGIGHEQAPDVVRENTKIVRTKTMNALNSMTKLKKKGKPSGKPIEIELKPKEFKTLADIINYVRRIKKTTTYIKGNKALNEKLRAEAKAAKDAYALGKTEEGDKWRIKYKNTIANAKNNRLRAKLTKDLKKFLHANKKSKVPVETKNKIASLLSAIDLVKMTKEKRAEIEAISKAGETLELSKRTRKELARLGKAPIDQMAIGDIEALIETISKLKKEGFKQQAVIEQKKAEEIERQLNELIVGTTRNLDKSGKTYEMILKLFPIEWANSLDSDQNYMGVNATMLKRTIFAEQEVHKIARERTEEALWAWAEHWEDHVVTKQDRLIMTIHLRAQEGAHGAVDSLLRHYAADLGLTERMIEVFDEKAFTEKSVIIKETKDGQIVSKDIQDLSELVPITDQQREGIEILRHFNTMNQQEVIDLYEKTKEEPFALISNYALTLRYEKMEDDSPEHSIRQDYDAAEHGSPVIRSTSTRAEFIKTRTVSTKKVPRIDLETMLTIDIAAREWYLGMQPQINAIKPLITSDRYREVAGKVGQQAWLDHLDIIANKGWLSSATHGVVDQIYSSARHNMTTAVLAFKVTTIGMQIFGIVDGLAFAAGRYPGSELYVMREFVKAWTTKGYVKQALKESETLYQRRFNLGDADISHIYRDDPSAESDFRKRVERLGMDLIAAPDVRSASAIKIGMEKYFAVHGLENKGEFTEAQESEFIMMATQSSALITMRPQFLARGEGSRAMFTFMSFFLARFRNFYTLVGRVYGKKGVKPKLAGMYGLLLYFIGAGLEEEGRETLLELHNKEIKEVELSLTGRVVKFAAGPIPYVGSMLESQQRGWGGGGSMPAQRVAEQAMRGVHKMTDDNPVAGMFDVLEAVMILRFGIPGTAQFFDSMEALSAE